MKEKKCYYCGSDNDVKQRDGFPYACIKCRTGLSHTKKWKRIIKKYK